MSAHRSMVLAAVLLVIGAGCGGDSGGGDEDAIRGTVRTYLDAMADGDYKGACAQLDTPARYQAERVALEAGVEANSCAEGLRGVVEGAGQNLNALHTADIRKVRVEKGVAYAEIDSGTTIKLIKSSGDWKILDLGI